MQSCFIPALRALEMPCQLHLKSSNVDILKNVSCRIQFFTSEMKKLEGEEAGQPLSIRT